MQLVRLVNLVGYWGKGRERSQGSSLGNINTIWRYWRRDRLNGENAKFSFECMVLEVLMLPAAQGQVHIGACSCNHSIRNTVKLIKIDEIR